MFSRNRNNLIKHLKKEGLLDDKRLLEAFTNIDRADFVEEELKEKAYQNIPLPIGHGQTISQPQVVAFMLNLLNLQKDSKVLDVGFGSGWTTALMAQVVKEGEVVGVEIIPEIYNYGKNNIMKYNDLQEERVKLFLGDGRQGKREHAPYDCILISAADRDAKLPLRLRDQLSINGRVVMPIRNSIFLFINLENDFEMHEYEGFSFVPLV